MARHAFTPQSYVRVIVIADVNIEPRQAVAEYMRPPPLVTSLLILCYICWLITFLTTRRSPRRRRELLQLGADATCSPPLEAEPSYQFLKERGFLRITIDCVIFAATQ